MNVLLLLLGCWEPTGPVGTFDSGSSVSGCRLSYLVAGSVSDVRVVDFTVDGLPTIVEPVELCTSLDGSQVDIGVDVDGTEAWISVKGDVGSSTALPATGVVLQIQYGAQTWAVDDFYLGEIRIDADSGAVFGEATGHSGQITIDVAW